MILLFADCFNHPCGILLIDYEKNIIVISDIFGFFRAYAFQETPDSLFSEAENRYKNGDYKLSLKLYNELLSDYPMSMYVPDAGYRIAVIKVRTGDLHGAEKVLRKLRTDMLLVLLHRIFHSGKE